MPERQKDGVFVSNFSEVVEGEIDRIAGLVSDLLDYAKSKDSKFAQLELHDEIDRVIGLTTPEFRKNGIKLSSSYKAQNDQIHGDSDQIRQVLYNLLINAQQAISDGGNVSVVTESVRMDDGSPGIAVTVSDDGEGMSQEEIEQAFTPFYSTKDSGSGLGLAITSTIMDKHGGSIHLASEQGVGTAVRLTFSLFSKKHNQNEGSQIHPVQP